MIVSAQSDCKAIYFTQDHSNLIKCFVEYMFAVSCVTSRRIIAILKLFIPMQKLITGLTMCHSYKFLSSNDCDNLAQTKPLLFSHVLLEALMGSYWNSLSQITALFGPKETWLCQALLYNSRQRWVVNYQDWSPCNWLFQIVGVLTKTSTLLDNF